jgi:hypothetical protein
MSCQNDFEFKLLILSLQVNIIHIEYIGSFAKDVSLIDKIVLTILKQIPKKQETN